MRYTIGGIANITLNLLNIITNPVNCQYMLAKPFLLDGEPAESIFQNHQIFLED